MQRHKECCEGEKTSLPAPTGRVDSRRPHSRKQMKGSRVFIAGASEGSAGKAVRGQAGLAHRHGAACCNKHILRGLVQSSHSVCLPQNTDSKPYQPQGTFSFTADISVHETVSTIPSNSMYVCVLDAPDGPKVPSKPLYVSW